uniref:TF-B3 domain-containing protein n=1 Tax=Brassica campestris TaxID=3711 RepID=M4D176_BRACM
MVNPPLQSPTNPHFFQPLLPGFDTHLTIPFAFFSKHIQGKTMKKTVKLRSYTSDRTWEVKIDGRRLTRGWNDFAKAHDLRIGDIIIFKHEGDMAFSVTPFGPSCCEFQYTQSHIIKKEADIDDDDEDDNERQYKIRNGLKPKTEPMSSYSFDYCFVSEVTASNLKLDTLYLPVGARSSSALNKRCHEMILVNKEGNSWTASLKFRESGGMYYIRRGWRRFCLDNRRKVGDLFVFNLVGDGKTTPMMCVCPEEECSELVSKHLSRGRRSRKTKKRSKWVASSSSRRNRFLTITLTRYNFISSKFILPIAFTNINGLNKYKEIILMDKHGVKRLTKLVQDGPHNNRRGLGKGWKLFCEANDVFKIGESFVLELVWEDTVPVLKFCSKNVPVAFFSKHVQGRNGDKTARLRSDASDTTWEVGELVFHVTALGSSCCEVEYTTLDDGDDNKETVLASDIKPMKKRAKKNPRKKDSCSCFLANVTVSSLHEDKLYVPVSFVRSNGLSNTYCKIVLLNEKGRSWKLSLVHDKSGSYLRQGWRSFCRANGINGGRYTFKLVRNSETPVIRLYQAEHRHEDNTHSYLVGSLTPSSLRNDTLYLSRRFVNSNGLKGKCCEMILKNDNGGTWCLVLRRNETNETTVISRGWRSFCHANGLKVRDPFKFKLVGTREKPVLQFCPSESNRNTRHVDCSEGDVHSLSKKEASSSPCQNPFVTLTVTQYSIKSNKLRLPLRFTRVNGINKAGKITLMGQDGVNWMVHLTNENKCGKLRLGRGWKGFCEAHGVKIGESFVLELIREKDATPVLKFCNKVNCV